MPAIVEFPPVMQDLLADYGGLSANAPERRHFASSLTGQYIAERKTVSAINREFAVTTEQSCLNRWITEVQWDVHALNQRRLDLLQREASTRYTKHGVIAIDNTLIDHDGKLIADVSWFWDHADQRHLIAHDENDCQLRLRYRQTLFVGVPSLPKEGRLRRRQHSLQEPHGSCKELIEWVFDQAIAGDFTFDSYFTNAEILNHIASKQRNYVGDLKFNRTITVDGLGWKAIDWVKTKLGSLCRQKTSADGKTQWYFRKSIRIPGVTHTVQSVVLWKEQRDAQPRKILMSNRTYWEVHRILKIYRKRWTGSETFHRDGKQHLGMDACQFRSGVG